MTVSPQEIRAGMVFGQARAVEVVKQNEVPGKRLWRAEFLCCGKEVVVTANRLIRYGASISNLCRECYAETKSKTEAPAPPPTVVKDANGHAWPLLTGWGAIGSRATEY